MSVWALGLAGLGAAAYAVLSHALMLHAADAPWAVAALLGPLLGLTAFFAARARQWLLLSATLAAVAGVAVIVAQGGIGQVERLYLLQHVGMHVALGTGFAVSLRQPLSLIGQLAQRVHDLTPAMVRYTRQVTLAWSAYFFGMAALSVAMFAFAPWAAWSLLANVVTPVAIVALFVGEYLLRYRLHPEFERVKLTDAVQAWRARAAQPSAAAGAAAPATAVAGSPGKRTR